MADHQAEPTSDYRFVTFEKLGDGRIARIMLNRPRTRNAQSRGLLVELNDAFLQAEADDQVRVVILAGEGTMFSSGHDLGSKEAMAEYLPGPGQHPTRRVNGGTRPGMENMMLQEWHYFFQNTKRWRDLRKITIAQLHGDTYAAALMLAWACDLIVCAEGTNFADVAGTRLGMCGVEYFGHPWEFGPRRAKELLLTGDSLAAEDAYRLGMVSKIFPAGRLADDTLAFAERIAQLPTMTALLIKESVNQTVDNMGFHNALNACFTLHQLNHAHWTGLNDDKWPAARPEHGIADWRDAPPVVTAEKHTPRAGGAGRPARSGERNAMPALDLVITNGIVVDGTGLPRRRADVGVFNGRIVAVGHVDVAGAGRVVDAEGRVVAPGIVDAHTHYDPQLTFEPYATSSCFHGVTTVVTGNCGFSVAPLRKGDAEWLVQLFARVEGMDPSALAGIPVDRFETFKEFLTLMDGRLGVNAAYYVGHCAVRRYIMGEEAQTREATDDEIEQMRRIVQEAVEAGAAGFSSTHSPTHVDTAGRPVPSRLSSLEELKVLVETAGRAGGASVAYLPFSAVGGLSHDDEELLIDLSLRSRSPVIIQGLGARSKVGPPIEGWKAAKTFLDRATDRGAAVYSLVMSRPFNRTFSLAGKTTLFEGALEFNRIFTEADSIADRVALLHDPGFRDAIRDSVEHPNTDPTTGPTLPPPTWDMVQVYRVARDRHRPLIGRSIAGLAADRNVRPADALVDLALDEELATEFVWRTETPAWIEGTNEAQQDGHMMVGTTDGGAHLDRDDGAESTTWFLQHWVREWQGFTLEEGVRQLTALPAGLCGLHDRGLVLPGYAADLMIFDPETVATGDKYKADDFPNGAGRWTSRPVGVHATIVNGVPIVLDGELQRDAGLPGQVLRPGRPRHA